MSNKVRYESPEVAFNLDPIVRVDMRDIDWLKSAAEKNKRGMMRLCAHPNIEDNLHEMFIVHDRDTYVRPHKHLNKSESLHVIEGCVDLVVFDDAGNITEVTSLGNHASGRCFYHRITEPRYHTLRISSDTLIFHEVTNGPFNRQDTLWAPWAPKREEISAATEYMGKLDRAVEAFASKI